MRTSLEVGGAAGVHVRLWCCLVWPSKPAMTLNGMKWFVLHVGSDRFARFPKSLSYTQT